MNEVDLSKKHPEKKIRAGPIAVAIWRNKTEKGDAFYSVSFEKRFKKEGSDEWRSTNSLSKNDIPKAVLALQEAYKYLVLNRNAKEIIEDLVGEGNV